MRMKTPERNTVTNSIWFEKKSAGKYIPYKP